MLLPIWCYHIKKTHANVKFSVTVWYISCKNKLLIHVIVSAQDVPVVLGQAITLSCPVDSHTGEVSRSSIKEWFRGVVPRPQATVAKLDTKGDYIHHSYTADERILISTVGGDLKITKLTLDDMGFYTCRFTGSNEQRIYLYAGGVFCQRYIMHVWKDTKLTTWKY